MLTGLTCHLIIRRKKLIHFGEVKIIMFSRNVFVQLLFILNLFYKTYADHYHNEDDQKINYSTDKPTLGSVESDSTMPFADSKEDSSDMESIKHQQR